MNKFDKLVDNYIQMYQSNLFDHDPIEEAKYVRRLAQAISLLKDQGLLTESGDYSPDAELVVEKKTLNFDYDVYEPNSNKNIHLVDYFYDALRHSTRSYVLTPYSKKELSNMLLFKVANMDAGFAIKETEDREGNPTRDIVGIHNNSKHKGMGGKLVTDAIKRDGQTLDHFDGFLTDFYSKLGFKDYALDDWADEYTPTDWPFHPIDIRKGTYHDKKWDKYDAKKKKDKTEQYRQGKPDVVYQRTKK